MVRALVVVEANPVTDGTSGVLDAVEARRNSCLTCRPSLSVQVSKADLDDAGDEEGNGGGHDYPSP